MTAAHSVGTGGLVLEAWGIVLTSCPGVIVPNAIAMGQAIVAIVTAFVWAAVVDIKEMVIFFLEFP